MAGAFRRILLASVLSLATAGHALAQSAPVERLEDQLSHGEEAKKDMHLLVVPLPVVDPSLGDGVILVTGLFYSPVQGGRQWVTGAATMYTSKGDKAFGLGQQADLMDGRLRLKGFGGYGQFKFDYFGKGEDAGSEGRSIALDEKGLFLLTDAAYEAFSHFYAGARLRYLKLDSSLAREGKPDDPVIPQIELQSTISGLGPAFEYDTRDNEFMPRRGVYVEGQWVFNAKTLGSDFSYDRMNLAANLYRPVGEKTVLALRGSVCRSGDQAPFYDLCMFGFRNDLRGYQSGRYRDHAMFAVQAEVRQQLTRRIGVVAFSGFGAVAPSFGDLVDAHPLPAFGFGLRVRPSMKIPINVAVDYAWGKDEGALYVSVGEAF